MVFDAGDKSATAIRRRGAGSAIVIQPDQAGASPNVGGIRTEALVELVDAGEEIEDVASVGACAAAGREASSSSARSRG
jgi:hypothetical protein